MATTTMNEGTGVPKEEMKIMGLSLPVFGVITAIVLIATYLKVLPAGMVGAFPIMMIIGAILNEIGDRTPIVKDFLGGGAIVVIFGSAALLTYGVLPESAGTIMTNFMKGEGFLDFYIAALITGSMLGMKRELLIKAAARYLPAILGAVIVALALAGLFGGLLGFGVKKAVFFIGLPIMGGGMGAGAVPLSKIFGESMQTDAAQVLSMMIPAVALGNSLSIVFGGLLNELGKKRPNLTGNGNLMRDPQHHVVDEKEAPAPVNYKNLGIGLLLATTFFAWGNILAKFIPLHAYALMIISVALAKSFKIIPAKYEICAFQWFQFIMQNLTPTLLVGIGVAYTDLPAVINSLTPIYIFLVLATVVGAVLGAGAVGYLFGFYPIESAITAGLCMANMGGTGDVAVLSAAKRMELMPFAQISSRIGGAFILLLSTLLLSMFA